MHPVHASPPYFPKINSNIILPSMAISSEWSAPFRFSNQNIVCISHISHASSMPYLPHPALLYHPNSVFLKCRSYEAPRCTVFSSLLSFPPSWVQIFHSAPCSQAPSVCFKSSSSGLWRHVVLWWYTSVSEVHAPWNEGWMDLWNVGALPQHHAAS